MGRLGSETGLETEERDYKILQASYIKVEGHHTLNHVWTIFQNDEKWVSKELKKVFQIFLIAVIRDSSGQDEILFKIKWLLLGL